jgi:ribokinase
MTIKEIAKLAEVSASTVSKIINNKDENINPQTRDRVLKIVKEYNYTPYGNIRNLNVSKSFTIAVLLKNGSHPAIINSILKTASTLGYHIWLLDSNNSTELELKNISAICTNRIDGVIWEPIEATYQQHERYFIEKSIPLCYINTNKVTNGFYIDYEKMGYVMTAKLLSYRHTNIGCLIRRDSTQSEMALTGFKKCLYDYQIPFHEKMLLQSDDPDLSSKILSLEYTGIISTHFTESLVLHETLTRLHYNIPEELTLISIKDDTRETETFPHISGIKIPFEAYGEHVCKSIIEMCEKTQENLQPFNTEINIDHELSLGTPFSIHSKGIIVVGSINIDTTFNVDTLPQANKTTCILNSTLTLGGKGANQAIGVAKLGHEVSLIGEIGNGTNATFIFDTLERGNVSTRGISRNSKLQTGQAYIFTEKDGESSISILPGANNTLSPDTLSSNNFLFKDIGFCLLSAEIPIDTLIAAAIMAKEQGAINIVKPATLKYVTKELLQHTDFFIPNRKEAAILCPEEQTIERQAEYFYEKGAKVVIITLGSQGCYLKTDSLDKYFPASDFTAFDTTGGADALICALAVYLHEGYDIESAIQIANYAAGFCISRQGVIPALVDRNMLETHIKKKEPNLLSKSKYFNRN